MTAKTFLSIALLFSFYFPISAQLIQQCFSATSTPADSCAATCVYCDFEGITSSTAGYTAQPPKGYCGIAENEQWLSLIANCNSMTLVATPSNCAQKNGLQMAVYSDCNSNPIVCHAGEPQGGDINLVLTLPTEPGRHYMVCVDGYAGDTCNFNLWVAPPICAGTPVLLPTLPISGEQGIAPGTTHIYTVPKVTGAVTYTWSCPGALINGVPNPLVLEDSNATEVAITFPDDPTAGVHEVCVRPSNKCAEGTEMCKVILIRQVPPTNFPQAIVCPNEPYTLPWGQVVHESGFYETVLKTSWGADSILRQFVLYMVPDLTVLPPWVTCQGDSVSICGSNWGQGDHEAVCTNQFGCDSTVYFSVWDLSANTPNTYVSNLCGRPNYYFFGKAYSRPGIYTDTISNGICSKIVTLTLVDESITAQVGTIIQPSVNQANGSISIIAQGGVQPYTYTWLNAQSQVVSNQSTADQLPAGSYSVEVQDASGCKTVQTFVLQQSVGIQNIHASDFEICVEPNPASKQFSFTTTHTDLRAATISLFTLEGKQIMTIPSYHFGDMIDVQHLGRQTIFAKITLASGDNITKRIILQ